MLCLFYNLFLNAVIFLIYTGWKWLDFIGHYTHPVWKCDNFSACLHFLTQNILDVCKRVFSVLYLMFRSYDFLRGHLLTFTFCRNHHFSSFYETLGWTVLSHYAGVLVWDKSLKYAEPPCMCEMSTEWTLGKSRLHQQPLKCWILISLSLDASASQICRTDLNNLAIAFQLSCEAMEKSVLRR